MKGEWKEGKKREGSSEGKRIGEREKRREGAGMRREDRRERGLRVIGKADNYFGEDGGMLGGIGKQRGREVGKRTKRIEEKEEREEERNINE